MARKYVVIHCDSSHSFRMENDVSLSVMSAWKVHLTSKKDDSERKTLSRSLPGGSHLSATEFMEVGEQTLETLGMANLGGILKLGAGQHRQLCSICFVKEETNF